MKVGVSTATLYGRAFNEEALSILNKIDASVIEIFLESFCEYNEEFANLLKSRLGNLKVHSIHSLNTHFEPQLFSHNIRAYSDAIKIYKDLMNCAKILDAQNYTFHGRIRIKKGSNFDNYSETADYFNKLTDLSQEYGVNLCLENVEWAMYNHAGYFTKLKPYVKNLKTCLDIKQARVSGYDYHLYLNEMASCLNTVHISDFTQDGKIVLPGCGLFDFERFIGELYNINFDGAVIIEVYKDSFTEIDEIYNSLNYIRNLVKRG